MHDGEIDLRCPQVVADNAAKGLRLRGEFGRGGTEIGVARATELKNREKLAPSTIRRMVSYFARQRSTSAAGTTAMSKTLRPVILPGCCGAATKAAPGRWSLSRRSATRRTSEDSSLTP